MMEKDKEKTVNNNHLSEQIINKAVAATLKTKGVAGLSTSGLLHRKKEDLSRAIKLNYKDEKVILDVYLAVEYEVCIPEIAFNLQKNIQSNVEELEGVTVKEVNIHIDKIHFPEGD